ncbi:dienelactone hydrolase family protein [Cryobacterium sp. 5B3]|uniref:dienelactone hydrolase family protein n=1 Tax=Cryobacterium sp. 5B3 TaxID=3048586 RepID=UPI002AB53AFB|nr:dienelactone hydrolase family protein [Cryobacterium sp. 5B3]MDY7541933.1 dienelactone hydrolase family protein [Cryobacterium sp. 5B3]MEB0276032.1 dienelactone hydrolase family protein [Cryobacterium sp. 5B3]
MAASGTPSAPVTPLTGWVRAPFTGAGRTYDCYEKGSGPGVVLIPEIPGITPQVLGLAEHLVAAGFTVVVPSPFGDPGRAASGGYILGTVLRLCVSSEFRAFATNAHRPITDYLRAVASDLASRTPGKGVGMIGQCFTGGFALAAAIDDSVAASVLSQPAVPFPLGRARRLDPGVSPEDFDRIAARASAGEVCALGLRFSEDGSVPRARFDTIKARLGEAFEIIQLDSSPGNPDGYPKSAHSVLTNEVRENPANSASAARDRVVAFLKERIG